MSISKRARREEHTPQLLHDDVTGMTFEYINLDETRLLHDEIVVGRCYEKHGIEIYDDAVIIDVGANIGLFSIWCGHQASGLRIAAIEPLPPIVSVLQANLTANSENEGVLRFEFAVLPLALGESKSSACFTYFPTSPGESTRNPIERLDTLRRVVSATQTACEQRALSSKSPEVISGLLSIRSQAEGELAVATGEETTDDGRRPRTYNCCKASNLWGGRGGGGAKLVGNMQHTRS
jgi:FkbM family methyltransferase